jgi:predicted transcriptional regulator
MTVLRDFQETIAEILECAQASQGISKTRVMYDVQLSFTQIKKYLKYLQQCKLLSYDEVDRVYRTTIEGNKFVRLYNEVTELMSGLRVSHCS